MAKAKVSLDLATKLNMVLALLRQIGPPEGIDMDDEMDIMDHCGSNMDDVYCGGWREGRSELAAQIRAILS